MISAVVLTKNEEDNIVDCLESVSWCDEIVVVDDNSIDRTIELARKLGATVYTRELQDNFSDQRNFGLEKARGDWVFFVDADERVPTSLREEIKYKIASIRQAQDKNSKYKGINGYYIQRRDFLWGKRLDHGETGDIMFLRLAKKDSGVWEGNVHEEWIVEGKVDELESELVHYPHQSVKEFLEEINRYTSIRAKELHIQGILVYWPSILLYPLGKFVVNDFIKRGFLDGIEGLIVALMMSFHSFLVRSKLWMLWQKK